MLFRSLDREAEEFSVWRRAHSIAPVLKQLRDHYEGTIRGEVERTLTGDNAAGLDLTDGAIGQFAARVSGKLLHGFYRGLRDIAAQDSPQRAEQITRRLGLGAAADPANQ